MSVGTQPRSWPGTVGIHRLELSTPFAVGTVNAYLLEGEPLTLIDTGPGWARSLDELEQNLGALGYRVEDLELILLTHQHIDHIGLLDVLVRRSAAGVGALDHLAPYLVDFHRNSERDDLHSELLMRRHGVSESDISRLRAVTTGYRWFGSSGEVTIRLGDGDRITAGGRTLQALHRPGHSPYDLVFWDEADEVLFAGDHLIARISSNPVITQEPGAAADDPSQLPRPMGALIAYSTSLALTRELPARVVLSGHQEPIDDHRRLIDERLLEQHARTQAIRRLLSTAPRTAHDLARGYWGDHIARTQAFLTLSEVLGHLDYLVEEGRVDIIVETDRVRFAAARGETGDRPRSRRSLETSRCGIRTGEDTRAE